MGGSMRSISPRSLPRSARRRGSSPTGAPPPASRCCGRRRKQSRRAAGQGRPRPGQAGPKRPRMPTPLVTVAPPPSPRAGPPPRLSPASASPSPGSALRSAEAQTDLPILPSRQPSASAGPSINDRRPGPSCCQRRPHRLLARRPRRRLPDLRHGLGPGSQPTTGTTSTSTWPTGNTANLRLVPSPVSLAGACRGEPRGAGQGAIMTNEAAAAPAPQPERSPEEPPVDPRRRFPACACGATAARGRAAWWPRTS